MRATAFLLGLVGSVTSCCTLPVIGAVVGYAGSMRQPPTRREHLIVGGFFMVGTVAALTLRWIMPSVKVGAGVMLIAVGFHLLAG